MSLEVAAKHLAAHGRGPDDHLIHMSGKEVAGLQALAMSAGGSLTINPKTGLPEAGFLDNLLPAIVGAGITYFSGGAIDPYTAAAMVGGVETARTGDVGKGFMAGLGGLGGANMVGGLAGAGANAGLSESLAGSTTGGEQVFGDIAATTTDGSAGSAFNEYLTSNANPAVAGGDAYRTAVQSGGSSFLSDPSVAGLGGYKALGMAAAPAVMGAMQPKLNAEPDKTPQMIRPYKYDYNQQTPSNMIGAQYQPTGQDTSERQYFNPSYTALPPYQAANGGIIALAAGGPVERMSNQAAMGANTMYPMANMATSSFATPYQSPVSTNMLAPTSDSGVTMNGEPNMQGTRMAGGGQVPSYGFGGFLGDAVSDIGSQVGHLFKGDSGESYAQQLQDPNSPASQNLSDLSKSMQGYQGMVNRAGGGITSLGGYSDGGRLLRGPGDGVSDSIPAQIGQHQPARLADGEFVVPARIVSELGNGSTEAGAKQLYKMLDRVQNARGKTTAKGKVAKNTNAAKLLPA